MYTLIITTFSFILGAVIGSFTHTFILRTRSGDDWINKKSKCDHCHTVIPILHNIPIISYLFLRGRCAGCEFIIPKYYLIVEIVGALIYSISTYILISRDISSLILIIYWIILTCLFLNTISDALHSEIYTNISYFFIISASIYAFLTQISLYNYLIGILVGGLFFGIQSILSRGKAIGRGDIYTGVGIGALLGWPAVIYTIFFSYILGLLFIIFTRTKNKRIPLTPFIAIATIVFLLYGESIIDYIKY